MILLQERFIHQRGMTTTMKEEIKNRERRQA